ncbi:MAG TPA: hypothetical protein VMU43_10005, partial [Candidatus Acidoferrum sp.]|nr:hypothetical protein [Candidatus Acidoferrum sp.]
RTRSDAFRCVREGSLAEEASKGLAHWSQSGRWAGARWDSKGSSWLHPAPHRTIRRGAAKLFFPIAGSGRRFRVLFPPWRRQ